MSLRERQHISFYGRRRAVPSVSLGEHRERIDTLWRSAEQVPESVGERNILLEGKKDAEDKKNSDIPRRINLLREERAQRPFDLSL